MAQREIPTWLQNQFYGGFSDDRFLGIKNSFRYAKGVEIRKNPNSLTLAYASEKDSASVITVAINAMVTIQSTGDIIAFGNSGKFYRKAYGGSTWVLVYTDTGSAHILNGFEYNDYLYWFTAGNVHRIAVADIDADWTGDVTEDYKAFTNSNANAHPAIEVNNKMYVGDGFYLAELDSLGTWTADKLEIFNEEEIRKLTYAGSMMRLFVRNSSKIDKGAKYYWDCTSTAWNERIPIKGLFHTALNDDNVDIMLAGKRPFLYKSSGYDNVPIKRIPLVYDVESAEIAPNAIDIYDGLIVIGLFSTGDASTGRGVWTFGREDLKYPEVLNFDYPTSNDNNTDKIYCVHNSNGDLYFSWGNSAGDTFGIDKINTSKFRSTGELHSRVMYGNLAKQEKEPKSFSIAFDKLGAGEKIEVYLRKDLASSWEDSAEIDADYTDTNDRNIYFKEFDDASDIGDFNFLETKIKLTAGTSQLTTPEFIELFITYDPIEKGDVS